MKKRCLHVFPLLVFFVVSVACISNVSASPGVPVTSMPSGNEEGGSYGVLVEQDPQNVSAMPVPEPAEESKKADAGVAETGEGAGNDKEDGKISDPAESLKVPETEEIDRADVSDDLEAEYVPEENEEKPVETIFDPLEPFNRAMYHFNDKLYFWLLKPVSQAYGKVVPEPARISVRNFFSNLAFPIRFLSCLLQADFRGAGRETGRFAVNTIWGIGGLMDVSSSRELNIPKQNVDLGQTLGVYGVGHGFYFVWPVLGPSSLRDSVDIVGRIFLYPVSYLNPWYTPVAVRGYEAVNETSLSIGDYEALKGAAIDPYLSIRDAFVQYRKKKIEARKVKPENSSSVEMQKP